MSENQLPVILPHEATFNTYVDRIKKHLTDAIVAWRQIASLLSAAADEFGLESSKMKLLRQQTGISKSKMSKLLSIANSKRLHDQQAIFDRTNAWTVLYEVTKLTDDEFAALLEGLSEGEVVTQKAVNAARTKIVKEPDPYKTVFSIQIDLNALKTAMFTSDDYQKLNEAIEVIQKTFDHVRTVETEEFNNEITRHFAEINREFEKLVRAEFKAAKKSYKQQAKDKTRFGSHSEEELMRLINDKEYRAAFAILASDRFNETELYQTATTNVYKMREQKFGYLLPQPDELEHSYLQAAA